MKPCRKVGLDITWRCNWHCRHCFYLRDKRLHNDADTPMPQVLAKLDKAKAGGLNHAVMVGFGEPTLCGNLVEIMLAIADRGMAASMITNGTAPQRVYENLVELGIDHFHISSHGTAESLAKVTGDQTARETQTALKQWLTDNGVPFRTNFAMQQANYRDMEQATREEIALGAWHCVLLGFLPHYEWSAPENTRTVLVHPAELRPHIEASLQALIDAGRYATVRYHPLCHLSPEYWPYVTNTRFVYFDPFEWNYELQAEDTDALRRASWQIGDGVAAAPCRACAAFEHCGGYNKRCLAALDDTAVQPLSDNDIPEQYRQAWDTPGAIFDQNPVNSHTGTIRERST